MRRDAEFLSYKERTSHSTDAQDSLNGEKIFCCERSSSMCPILYPKTINDSFHTHVQTEEEPVSSGKIKQVAGALHQTKFHYSCSYRLNPPRGVLKRVCPLHGEDTSRGRGPLRRSRRGSNRAKPTTERGSTPVPSSTIIFIESERTAYFRDVSAVKKRSSHPRGLHPQFCLKPFSFGLRFV